MGGAVLLMEYMENKERFFRGNIMELVYWEEVIFFVVFLLWTYMAGFHPAAHGTEKYMDFGFMKSMMRSTTRFIGFDPPVTGDETIHEFPSYSFVIGDLHAHVINVFFVLAVIGDFICMDKKKFR